jgi:hypothetical protein
VVPTYNVLIAHLLIIFKDLHVCLIATQVSIRRDPNHALNAMKDVHYAMMEQINSVHSVMKDIGCKELLAMNVIQLVPNAIQALKLLVEDAMLDIFWKTQLV